MGELAGRGERAPKLRVENGFPVEHLRASSPGGFLASRERAEAAERAPRAEAGAPDDGGEAGGDGGPPEAGDSDVPEADGVCVAADRRAPVAAGREPGEERVPLHGGPRVPGAEQAVPGHHRAPQQRPGRRGDKRDRRKQARGEPREPAAGGAASGQGQGQESHRQADRREQEAQEADGVAPEGGRGRERGPPQGVGLHRIQNFPILGEEHPRRCRETPRWQRIRWQRGGRIRLPVGRNKHPDPQRGRGRPGAQQGVPPRG
mmetsp:Transcript_9809/g.19693  ORF Transcript_9809/g.19693 Transcript_9809/m.19693 type:complete len:261 (+) Transcript_9809:451-1233(+)